MKEHVTHFLDCGCLTGLVLQLLKKIKFDIDNYDQKFYTYRLNTVLSKEVLEKYLSDSGIKIEDSTIHDMNHDKVARFEENSKNGD